MNWFLFWLFAHLLAAVIAFGPLFVFPIVATLAQKSPQNLGFAIELNHRIETRLVMPLALSMFVSGVGLIWVADINVFQTVYLLVAIALYLTALVIALTVLLPTTRRVLHLIEQAAPTAAVPTPSPPPVMPFLRRLQAFGGIATALFLAIILLMVVQPGGLVTR